MSEKVIPYVSEHPRVQRGAIVLAEGVPSPVSDSPSFENAQRFLAALSRSIDGKNPSGPFGFVGTKYRTYSILERNWEILRRHIETDELLSEIGDHYGISKQRVEIIIKKLYNQAYDTAPEDLRTAIPREMISLKKPNSLHKMMRASEARGGKMREVVGAIVEKKGVLQIQDETGVSSNRLSQYRGKGINAPYIREGEGREYQEKLRFLADGLLDDYQVRRIFKDIEDNNRRSVVRTLKKAGVIVPLGKAARDEGVFIHKHQSAIYDYINKRDIPSIKIFYDKKDKKPSKPAHYVLNNHENTRESFKDKYFDSFRKS